ncbi:MOV10 [Bugula neritina]|uniref:MOV10 n=1 Tax=Bugula neritina TaxID=10212 RepID=A0A7J7KFR6_BUGNE|nr:MOV10 [Bugula neritina]
MIFHRVDGREEQEESSPSWFNRLEVVEVKKYVEKLLFEHPRHAPEDIGIISPYILQVKKIKRALRDIKDERLENINVDIEDITVGSVEKFQGNERKVIIISTVRSQPEQMKMDQKFNLGFVKSPKRFNVAITRAKALLIVIGNPIILCTDDKWRR